MTTPCDRLSANKTAIFLFHGVVADSHYQVRNYTKKHLLADEFRGIISALCRKGSPLSLDQFLELNHARAPLPTKSFVITFDDGFANNLEVAAPILGEFKVPATFYVSTQLVDENAMSWIDRIEHCLESCGPVQVKLPWKQVALPATDSNEKINLLREVRAVAKNDPRIDLDELVLDIARQIGVPPVTSSDDPLDRKLTWPEVRELSLHPFFTVGGHSHRHVNLAFLEPQELEAEVTLSLRLLAEKAGLEPRHYSYPEGFEHCYSPAVIASLKRHGIVASPTAIDGLNPPGSDPFHLRRIFV